MDYISLLDNDVLSIVLQYVIEFNDFSLLLKLIKLYKNIGNIMRDNNMMYINLLNNLGVNDTIRKFVITLFNKNGNLIDNITTYRQLRYAIVDSETLLKNIDYGKDFLFDVQLINLDISILNLDFIPFTAVKIVYNLYLDNRYQFITPGLADEGPPQLLIFNKSGRGKGKYLCRIDFEFKIDEDQLRCLIIVLLFNNYNISTIDKKAYEIIGENSL